MKIHLAFALSSLVPAATALQESGSWTPKIQVGDALVSHFTWELEGSGGTEGQRPAGRPRPGVMAIDNETSATFALQFHDQIVGATDGVPTAWDRKFVLLEGERELTQTTFGEKNRISDTLESDLSGKVVEVRQAGDGFELSFPKDERLEQAYLHGLKARFGLLDLLPEGDAKVDESWRAPVESLWGLLHPGGDLRMHPDRQDDYQPGPLSLEPEHGGSLQVTFLGPHDERPELWVLQLEVDCETTVDDTPSKQSDGGGRKGMRSLSAKSSTRKIGSQGSGTALWDSESGWFVSVELELELETESTLEVQIPGGPEFSTTEQESSELSFEARFERPQ